MPFDTMPFWPPTRPRPVYDQMDVRHDDGVCACLGSIIVSGQTLNGVFPAPYFDPRRTYWVGDGRVQVIPETES